MEARREQMIIRHMPLVNFVVGRMSGEGPRTLGLEREDALSYGVEGLIQAVDAFDPRRGTSFASFAVRRIRGSILDAIRKMDPLPRSLPAQRPPGRSGVAGARRPARALADHQGARLPARRRHRPGRARPETIVLPVRLPGAHAPEPDRRLQHRVGPGRRG